MNRRFVVMLRAVDAPFVVDIDCRRVVYLKWINGWELDRLAKHFGVKRIPWERPGYDDLEDERMRADIRHCCGLWDLVFDGNIAQVMIPIDYIGRDPTKTLLGWTLPMLWPGD